jgi:alpha-beta hydrolase superfamily lysophospholipase
MTPADSAAYLRPAEPHFFGPPSQELFAWLHAASESRRRDAAVVCCPPFGFEYTCVYRTWRLLAERLAAEGFDVLRLDYPGTGNSTGALVDPGVVGTWLQSVGLAVAEARRLRPGTAVALLGVRLGAVLAAASAAALGDVERVILWSPLPSGKSFVREAKALARLARDSAAPEEPASAEIEVAGFHLTEEATRVLSEIDLLRLAAPPAPHALLVERDDLGGDARLAERLRSLGCVVTSTRPPGTAAALDQRMVTPVPQAVLDEVAGWLENWRAANSARETAPRPAPVGALAGPGHSDRAIRFGRDGRLFGFLAEPARARAEGPTVILLTAGCAPHTGPHRLHTGLARNWAARGHAVLRFDLGGIGESRPPGHAATNVAYPEHALDDILAALETVAREIGRQPVALAGLCSGGWHAFRAAREGLPVDAIFSVNPQLYLSDPAQSIAALDDSWELERYQRSLSDPQKWIKALRGEVSYRTFASLAGAALRRKLIGGLRAVAGRGRPSELSRDLETVARRGIETLFVWSPGDLGLQYLRLQGAAALRQPAVQRRVRILTVPEGDHTFRAFAAQRRLVLELRVFVERLAAARAREAAASPALPPPLSAPILETAFADADGRAQ